MAIDKSKENTRIAKYLAMSAADVHLLCSVGINNPAILKQFQDDTFKWEYAVAAARTAAVAEELPAVVAHLLLP